MTKEHQIKNNKQAKLGSAIVETIQGFRGKLTELEIIGVMQMITMQLGMVAFMGGTNDAE